MKINRLEIPVIVRSYTVELIPIILIAKKYGVNRITIYKLLQRAGVNTSYHDQAHIATICDHCKKEITVIRSIFRKRLHSFCNAECYYAWLNRNEQDSPLVSNRQGMRIAKKVIESTGFFVEHGMIVHHEDRNNNNNEVHNLRVFKDQGDHVRYHRGFSVSPIWNGLDHKNKPSPETKRLNKHIATTEKE